MSVRCTALFRDLLGDVYNGLLEYVVEVSPPGADAALGELSELGKATTEAYVSVTPESVTDKQVEKNANKALLAAEAGSASNNIRAELGTAQSSVTETATKYAVEHEDKIVFPAVSAPLRRILDICKCSLFLLIDEWSSLPLDVQPYLAEFLKRSFFPLADVAVKIASLEHRSAFGLQTLNGVVGFEIGADISALLDIDDYYVYDRNPDRITDAFGDMLVKHLSNELPPGYLAGFGINGGSEFASRLFTERKVFQELVRASEG